MSYALGTLIAFLLSKGLGQTTSETSSSGTKPTVKAVVVPAGSTITSTQASAIKTAIDTGTPIYVSIGGGTPIVYNPPAGHTSASDLSKFNVVSVY